MPVAQGAINLTPPNKLPAFNLSLSLFEEEGRKLHQTVNLFQLPGAIRKARGLLAREPSTSNMYNADLTVGPPC